MHRTALALTYVVLALGGDSSFAATNTAKSYTHGKVTHDWRKREFEPFVRKFPNDVFINRNAKKILVEATSFTKMDDAVDAMNAPIDEFMRNFWFGGDLGGKVFQLSLNGIASMHTHASSEGPYEYYSAHMAGDLLLERKDKIVKARNQVGTEMELELVSDAKEKADILSSIRFVPLPSNRRAWLAGKIANGDHFYLEDGAHDAHPSLFRAYGGQRSGMRELDITDVSYPMGMMYPFVETEMGTVVFSPDASRNGRRDAFLRLREGSLNNSMATDSILLEKAHQGTRRWLGLENDVEPIFVPYFGNLETD